jgi:hypothetical protein
VSELPARPSLAHLRKQAKALLQALRQQNPDASLSEAQHALAAKYGFASWPKLKAYVERRAAHAAPPIFPRFTPKARESLFFSWHEANQLRSGVIEPAHLVLGLIRAGAGLKGRLFGPSALPLDRARALMTGRVHSATPVPPDRYIVPGPRVQQVFRAAVEEADAHHHEGVGLAHLLIGLFREGDAVATGLLDQMGIDLRQVRDGLATYMNEEPG